MTRHHRRPIAATNAALFDGAAGRMYIRRNAGPQTLRRIANHLRRSACGHFEFAQWGDWTIVDLETQEDLLMLRHKFLNLFDGWKEFS
jgi:hypothetical protein